MIFMTNRFNVRSKNNFGVPGLPSGYDNNSHTSFFVPPVGVEDVDRSLFNLFDKELQIFVTTDNGVKKVPVIFSSGEKWAMIKKGKAIRDNQGSLILPLITIGRNTIQQNPVTDINGRGINQQVGELVIKRRLAPEDRDYQSLLNKALVLNQENVFVNEPDASSEQETITQRQIGESQETNDTSLAASNTKNVWEFFTLPTPQFFTAKYEITLWTTHTSQMNEILECLISSFLPQGNSWKLLTDKGYWFIASVDGNAFTPDNNFDDMSTTERMIKYKFEISVPAYMLASSKPGMPIPLRRYVSRPEISFSVAATSLQKGISDPFLGSDDPTLPMGLSSKRRDGRDDGSTRLFNDGSNDVALNSKIRGNDLSRYRKITAKDKKGNVVQRYVKVSTVNSQGETTYSATNDLSDFSVIINND